MKPPWQRWEDPAVEREGGIHGADHHRPGDSARGTRDHPVRRSIDSRAPSRDADIDAQTDFRSVDAAVLEYWLRLDAKSALGAVFLVANVLCA